MKRLHVDGRLCCSVAAPCTEHIGSPAFELPLPRCDLVGVDIELLRKLSQCSIAFDGGKRHFRFENRCMVPARSSGHGLSCFAVAQRACCQAETPPIVLYRFPGPALVGLLMIWSGHRWIRTAPIPHTVGNLIVGARPPLQQPDGC